MLDLLPYQGIDAGNWIIFRQKKRRFEVVRGIPFTHPVCHTVYAMLRQLGLCCEGLTLSALNMQRVFAKRNAGRIVTGGSNMLVTVPYNSKSNSMSCSYACTIPSLLAVPTLPKITHATCHYKSVHSPPITAHQIHPTRSRNTIG